MTGVPASAGRWAEMVRLIEQLAANAWPAAQTRLVDGWLFRVTPGVERRRSNSALPVLVPPMRAASHRRAVDHVEAFYRAHGQLPWVQVSPAELHVGLDRELQRRGYERVVPTDVQLAPVGRVLAGTTAAPGLTVRAEPAMSDAWLRAELRVQPRPPAAQRAEAEWVLGRISPPATFLTALDGDLPVGVCLLAAERGWAGLFSMATHPDARRRGVATTLLQRGAQWAAQHGARHLYLQVEPDSEPAIALYRGAGFRRAYGYHYRGAPAGRGDERLRDLRR